jgi:hypothetical protein
MDELQKKIKRDIESILKDQKFIEFMDQLKQWKENHSKDFKVTLKSLKAHFTKEGYIFPKNWDELFWAWIKSSPKGSELRKIMEDTPANRKIFEIEPIPKEYFLQWAKEETQRLTAKEDVDKLENLPHKLCILYELEILDLLEEKFKDKNYKGKARETDKAKLIASLLEINDAEKVRNSLRKRDFLSTIAKKNAAETLKRHGLELKKLTD